MQVGRDVGGETALALHGLTYRSASPAILQAGSTVNFLGLRAYVSSSRPFLGVPVAFT